MKFGGAERRVRHLPRVARAGKGPYNGCVSGAPEAARDLDRGEIAAMARACPEVRLVVLFGSLARGQARANSDMDLGVLGGGFWETLDLGGRIADKLHREPHVVDLGSGSDLLRFEVARHGVPLYESEPSAWARFQAEAAIRYWDMAPWIKLCADGVRRRLLAEAKRG